MAADEPADPYLDPATGILRNLVGALTQRELDAAESALAHGRGLELLTPGTARATGDLEEFRAIHRHLFQDVYEWAGEIRSVDMRKNVQGAQFFLPVSMIERAAGFSAEQLRDDKMLRGLDRDSFIERLSHHYDQWNYIHPFREGNGRTQRTFWNRIARDAGWRLDWTRTTEQENVAASRAAAENEDLAPLRAMFTRVVVVDELGQDSASGGARLATQGVVPPVAGKAGPSPQARVERQYPGGQTRPGFAR